MRKFWIVLGFSVAAAASLAWVGYKRPLSTSEPLDSSPAALKAAPSEADPAPPSRTARSADAPIDAAEPGLPLEERGDALLFEIDALQGTPFDPLCISPFD